jgi:pSer/pThr/pTyr-binding forkhead associated (FHA) protein
MGSIVIVEGPNTGDYYPLGKRTNVVGRGESCPIQIVDQHISRKHFQIRFDRDTGQYHLLDMRSANGIKVNGNRISAEVTLRDGDTIEIGETKIMFYGQEFDDRETAMNRYKQQGQRGKSTLVHTSDDE